MCRDLCKAIWSSKLSGQGTSKEGTQLSKPRAVFREIKDSKLVT